MDPDPPSDYTNETKGMVVQREQEHQNNLKQLQQQLLSMGKRGICLG